MSTKSKMSSSSSSPTKPITRRQSHRVRKQTTRASTPHLPLTPRASQSPSPSRPSTPVSTAAHNRRASSIKKVSYTTTPATTGSPSSSAPAPQQQQPTVNWDCISYVISDQKIHSTYSKPSVAAGTTTVTSYGRVVTTTTTTTVTTTIATTEILHPGEAGYEESLARQKEQESTPGLEQRFAESRAWSAGTNKEAHEGFHQLHHRTAEPARAVVLTAA